MTLGEQYYNVALDDLYYLEAREVEGYYNQPSALCQQVCEKLLKSLIADYYVDENLELILKSHSLKKLAFTVKSIISIAGFNIMELAFLSDFYFDARYPGPDYVKVDEETYLQCNYVQL